MGPASRGPDPGTFRQARAGGAMRSARGVRTCFGMENCSTRAVSLRWEHRPMHHWRRAAEHSCGNRRQIHDDNDAQQRHAAACGGGSTRGGCGGLVEEHTESGRALSESKAHRVTSTHPEQRSAQLSSFEPNPAVPFSLFWFSFHCPGAPMLGGWAPNRPQTGSGGWLVVIAPCSHPVLPAGTNQL